MMRRFWIGLVMLVASAAAAQAQAKIDSVASRARQLAEGNDSAASRAVLDSVINAKTATLSDKAEATYWRSRFAASAAERERLLTGLIVDNPFSPRLPAALYELGMLELSHNVRDRAVTHLSRYLMISAGDSNWTGASLTVGRLLLERGEAQQACAILQRAAAQLPDSIVELRNQFDFSLARCQGVDTTTRAPAPPSPPDTLTATTKSGAFTVQVAAYETKPAAERLATTLRGQGLEARVIGTTKPFRVRVGRYATRAEAEDASRKVDAVAKSKSIVVVVGPEEK